VNIRIPETQLPDAATRQARSSFRVVSSNRVRGMTTPVQLDGEPSVDAIEVDDERAEGMLAPKLEGLELPGPESIPEKTLGRCQVAPQATGVVPMDSRQS
jgi:hypothetical protein